MKLHLGCGERYLEGYINIDYPSSEHTVQRETVADQLVDILELNYPAGSIEEIRLHHLFEHFPRAISCALLATWNVWLTDGGRLHIEVPDFRRMMCQILNPFASQRRKCVAERHIFGSQEAGWAMHLAGYSIKGLTDLIQKYGFNVIKTSKNSWKGTSNIEVIAKKEKRALSQEDFESISLEYLRCFLLDDSDSEIRLLETWMRTFRKQARKGLGSCWS